jgi:hypothetical protein
LVLHEGKIRLFDEEIKEQLSSDDFPILKFSKINVNGKCKYIYGDLAKLIREAKTYYPEVHFPVSVQN